jgi:hypothetical protein
MMKAFFSSFLVVCLAGATAWQIGRNRLSEPTAPTPGAEPLSRSDVSANHSPSATLARLFAARDPKKPHERPGTREFAALATLPTGDIATWMRTRPPMPHDHFWNAAALEWASRDGAAALAFALDLRARHPRTGDCACCGGNPGGQFHELVKEVYAVWVAADADSALAHGAPAPAREPGNPNPPTAPAIETLALHDLGKCLDLAANEAPFELGNMSSLVHMMDSPNRNHGVIEMIARHLALPGKRAEFTSWLEHQPDAHAALGIFSRVWQGVDHEPGWLHPEQIPSWIPLRDKMPVEFTDPKMVRFMGSLAVGAHPLEMMEAKWNEADELCAHAWAFRDPESATAWADAQTPDADLDFALVGLARGLGYTDPAAATARAARIHRKGTRLRETIRHFSDWRRADPAAARTWLESSSLPTDERLALGSGVTTSFW